MSEPTASQTPQVKRPWLEVTPKWEKEDHEFSYRDGLFLAIATIVGAIIGAYVSNQIFGCDISAQDATFTRGIMLGGLSGCVLELALIANASRGTTKADNIAKYVLPLLAIILGGGYLTTALERGAFLGMAAGLGVDALAVMGMLFYNESKK